MRDSYVLVIFLALIGASTYLASVNVLDAKVSIIPIVTGFLGLLAKLEKPIQPSVSLMQRLGISKPPAPHQPLVDTSDKENDQ